MDSISILKYDLDQKVFNIGGQFVSNGKNSFGVIYNSEKEPFYYHVDEKSRLVKAFEANYASYPKFSVNRNNRLLLSDDFRYVSDLNCLNNLKITYFDTSFATNNCAKTLDISLGFPVKERFKTLGNSIELLNTFGFTLKDTLFESDEYSLEAQISCSNNTGLAYANLGNDTVVCDTFVLSASIFKFPKAKYYWNTGDTSFAIRVDSSGKYDLRVTNGGCTSYDSINIIFDDDLELSIDYDSVLCINDSLPLFLNKVYPYNLVYTFPNNIKVNSKNGDTIYIKEPGNYRVKSANTSGCKLDRQFNVYSTLVSAFAGRDSIFCKGSTISLNGAGNGSPKWEPSNLLMNPDSFNPTWTNVLDTFFILNVADESGCTASDTVYFMTFSKPTAFLQNDTIEYCVGEPTELKFGVTNGKPPYQLDWKNGDENQSGDFKIKAWIAEGEDNFKIKVTDSCKNEVWFYRNFLKRETGLEELLILPNDSVKTGSEIIIKSSTGNELTFKSKNGEKEVSREFKFSNKDNGMYSLQIGTLDSVCKSDTVINLWFYQVNWYLPNAFTPSDNNLINDEWTAYCANCKFKTISIFNKGGQMVFKTESGKAWDGTFKNEKVPSGTYYFITKAVDFDGSEYTLSGNILLLE
jgi:gliding motility-associated-like protein